MLGTPHIHVSVSLQVDAAAQVTDQQQDMQDAMRTNGPQQSALNPLGQPSRDISYSDADIRGTLRPTVRLRTDGLKPQQLPIWQRRIYTKEHLLPLSELGVDLPATWTCVTGDTELVRHLLALYFCWEYPNFAPISKEHFLQDFCDKRHRYCSPMLVNALLALGCHLSDRSMTAPNNASVTGDTFFEESRRLFLSATDCSPLTTIQALVIMSIREARCSRLSESTYYAEQAMRLAIEADLHEVPAEGCEVELAVLAKTFWGTFTLNK